MFLGISFCQGGTPTLAALSGGLILILTIKEAGNGHSGKAKENPAGAGLGLGSQTPAFLGVGKAGVRVLDLV